MNISFSRFQIDFNFKAPGGSVADIRGKISDFVEPAMKNFTVSTPVGDVLPLPSIKRSCGLLTAASVRTGLWNSAKSSGLTASFKSNGGLSFSIQLKAGLDGTLDALLLDPYRGGFPRFGMANKTIKPAKLIKLPFVMNFDDTVIVETVVELLYTATEHAVGKAVLKV